MWNFKVCKNKYSVIKKTSFSLFKIKSQGIIFKILLLKTNPNHLDCTSPLNPLTVIWKKSVSSFSEDEESDHNNFI